MVRSLIPESKPEASNLATVWKGAVHPPPPSFLRVRVSVCVVWRTLKCAGILCLRQTTHWQHAIRAQGCTAALATRKSSVSTRISKRVDGPWVNPTRAQDRQNARVVEVFYAMNAKNAHEKPADAFIAFPYFVVKGERVQEYRPWGHGNRTTEINYTRKTFNLFLT